MRIAVTGAAGVLGKYLVAELTPDYDFRLLGRSRERLERVFGADGKHALSPVDYSVTSLQSALTDTQAVVHLAGGRPGAGSKGPELYRENLRISLHLFEACESLGISNVVFASSTSVYTPGVDPGPFDEDRDLYPVSLYAAAKLAVEKAGKPFKLRLKSLRIAPMIGLGEKEEYMRMAYVYWAFRKESLVIHGDGSGQREYIYAKDVARAIGLALTRPELSAVFNIGSGECISQRDYAALVNDVFADGQSEIIHLPEYSGYLDTHCMSCRKAERILGFRPVFSLREALLDLKKDMENENSFQ